jgi:hypothetical protein
MTDTINLGQALNLVRHLTLSPRTAYWDAPPSGPFRDTSLNGRNEQRSIEGRRIEVMLQPDEKPVNVDIEDLGLRQAYVIFGLPGTGKTVLIKHVLDLRFSTVSDMIAAASIGSRVLKLAGIRPMDRECRISMLRYTLSYFGLRPRPMP